MFRCLLSALHLVDVVMKKLCGNDIPILWDDLLDSEKQDSIITCNLCELFEKTIHEVLWAKHGWDDLSTTNKMLDDESWYGNPQ